MEGKSGDWKDEDVLYTIGVLLELLNLYTSRTSPVPQQKNPIFAIQRHTEMVLMASANGLIGNMVAHHSLGIPI